MAITCLVADDHPAVVQAVSEVLIAGGVDVIAQSRDGEEALEFAFRRGRFRRAPLPCLRVSQ